MSYSILNKNVGFGGKGVNDTNNIILAAITQCDYDSMWDIRGFVYGIDYFDQRVGYILE